MFGHCKPLICLCVSEGTKRAIIWLRHRAVETTPLTPPQCCPVRINPVFRNIPERSRRAVRRRCPRKRQNFVAKLIRWTKVLCELIKVLLMTLFSLKSYHASGFVRSLESVSFNSTDDTKQNYQEELLLDFPDEERVLIFKVCGT